ncbi:YdeI/OmpD-associated family protein [Ruminococcus sp. OA3]|uniref:YdeI/OmpD-associated family protein n=1 Tax=Ruminococcus sp. OA3 TaxID=2914164 RepID=UPI001F060BFD|nr:YdeI/OmpD-associated family protein [Ruminococcus sp. OA3]MCH1981797.1 YdeI/OmpD-associated family protein [Ruminococcus sp. OA3]
MNEMMKFSSREDFRKWLNENCLSEAGIWLLFGKAGGPKTLKASEALEEALCFGWIDGQMQRIDDVSYKKYFSLRRENSKWSEKNKALTEKLEKQGIMTDYGRRKMEEAKKNGQWNASKPPAITEDQIASVSELLKEYEPAYTNFLSMSPSVKKTYTRGYFDAKTDAGRSSRLSWMVERLNKNLKPM